MRAPALIAAALALLALFGLALYRWRSSSEKLDVIALPAAPPRSHGRGAGTPRGRGVTLTRRTPSKAVSASAAPTAEPPPPTALPKEPVALPAEPALPSASADIGPPPPPSDYGWKGPDGIALFPPPGTNPPKAGMIVPDDFELPPGYVRYHQTTDDGTELAPILAFHPDYELLDENGNAVPLPPDLVVPPELAPPGMPIEILKVPETHYPQGPSQEEINRFLSEHPEVLEDGVSPEEVERILREHQESPPQAQK
jgi:hypothetical protein